MRHDSEYRYSPGPVTSRCPEHAGCLIRQCQRLFCSQLFHVTINRRGQPRQYCSTACRVAEHRRLRG